MNLLETFAVALMLGLLLFGLYLVASWELESRIVGISTLVGDGLAIYLFFRHWLFVHENNAYGIGVIALLAPAGYLAGLALRSLIHIDWFEDLIDIKPLEITRAPPPSVHGHG